MALSGLCSTVQAMESTGQTVQAMKSKGQKVIQSHCFEEVLDFLPFKDQIKIQGLNQHSYKKMENHMKRIPLTYKFTVNGNPLSDDKDQRDQFNKDSGNMVATCERAKPQNIHIHFETHLDVDVFNLLLQLNEDREPEQHVKSLRLTNVEFGSEGSKSRIEGFDVLTQLKELKMINCKYSAFDHEANQTQLEGLMQGDSCFQADEEKVFLCIGNAPALEKIVVTEDPNEQRTMQVSIFGHCPNLKSVELSTKHAQETLEPFLPHVRKDLLCEEGGTVHPKCAVYTNVTD